jgi:hypothetical protein
LTIGGELKKAIAEERYSGLSGRGLIAVLGLLVQDSSGKGGRRRGAIRREFEQCITQDHDLATSSIAQLHQKGSKQSPMPS